MTDRSTQGFGSYETFLASRLAHEATAALLLDARMALVDGDVARALDDVRGARGMMAHVQDADSISTGNHSFVNAMQGRILSYTLQDLMPAVPAGQMNPAEWENALNPR